MKTPILILAHQRPELLQKCLYRLEEAGCANLYASVDGPSDTEAHDKVVKLLQAKLRPDRLQILPKNLGCEKGVLAGINWFFDQVDAGIIVEEDVLISDAGLQFLSDCLERYRSNLSVFMAGAHLPTGQWDTGHSHFFSRVGHIWGWATWKDKWSQHKPEDVWESLKSDILPKAFGHTRLAKHFRKHLDACERRELDTWDFQWNLTMLANGGVCAHPVSNQAKNIGISEDALHTRALHKGVCNEFQSWNKGTPPTQVRADREYEHEWFRRLKGERSQLKNAPDTQLCKASNTFEGRVALVNSTDLGGGAERVCFDLLKHCKQAKQLLVAVKKSDDCNVSELVKPGGFLNRIVGSESDLMRKVDPVDIVHFHNIHGLELSWNELLKLADQKTVVWTLHDQWILGKNDTTPFSEGEISKKKLSFVQHLNVHLTTPSLWLQDKVYWNTGKLPWLVKNGIDTDLFQAKEREQSCRKLDLAPDRQRILFLAKNPETNPYKDLLTLKNAWLKVNDILGENGFDLYCLGGKPKVEEHGNYRFEIIRPTHDPSCVADWLNACDISINSTVNDNSPVSLIEAMANKTPVIASNVGGINELLESGWAGRLVNKQDEDVLSKAIIECKSASELTAEMAETAYKKVKREHSIRAMCDSYLGLYSKLSQ